MAFVDELHLDLTAGRGGDGVVRWLHMKGKDRGGPSGGDGGNGGDVVFRAVRDLAILSQYTGSPKMEAEDGAPGGKNVMAGKGGDDLVLDLPLGSLVTRESDGETFELLEEGKEVKVLSGGRGGLGNAHFKSSTNINPIQQTDGKPGDASTFRIELRLIADVGLVGLPNAGKSSLLNTLTNARSEVGNYNFTTLEPHLGTLYEFVIADIPGIIEGASEGRGLGHKFLRHIQRTREILHCVSVENEDVVKTYDEVRRELERFDSEFSGKDEIILLTKSDEATKEELREKKEALENHTGKQVRTISILDDTNVKEFRDFLVSSLRE